MPGVPAPRSPRSARESLVLPPEAPKRRAKIAEPEIRASTNQYRTLLAYFGSSNAMNEILGVAEHDGSLVLRAQLGFSFGRLAEGLNLEHLAPDEAAEYLWRRLVSH